MQKIIRKYPSGFFTFIMFSFSIYTFSQQYLPLGEYNVDSLQAVLLNQQGEERINTLNNHAITIAYDDVDLSKQYAGKAIEIASEIGYQEGIAEAYWILGWVSYFESNYVDALSKFYLSLDIFEDLNLRYNMARIYAGIAVVNFYAANYEKAIEYCQLALDIFREPLEGGETVGDVRDTINAIQGMGLSYLLSGMYDKSLECYLMVLEVGEKNNFGITELMLNTFLIADRYNNLGETDSAQKYINKALSFPDDNPSIEALKYRPLTYLAYLYYYSGKVDTAINIIQAAFEWYDNKGFLYFALDLSHWLGALYLEKHDLINSEKYYLKSEKIFNEWLSRNSWYRYDSLKHIASWGTELYIPLPFKEIKEMMWGTGVWMYDGLYKLYEARQIHNESLKYHIAYTNAKDTLNALKQNRETMELQTRYETELKEEQIDILSRENEFTAFKLRQSRVFITGLAILVVLIVVLAIVLVRQNKLRELQRSLVLQQKLFRSQMNPHFLFNSLSSIHNFIIHEESARAGQYLSKFSKLVRNILDSSVEEHISLEKELSTIENYLELQKIRFPEKFNYSIEIDEKIDTEITYIPPMLLQPFLENSIEHGFKHKETRGTINICFRAKNGMMGVELNDDGIGREKAKEILLVHNKDHKSYATSITYERIGILNKKMKKNITLNIIDLEDEANNPVGTKVVFEIPVVYV